MRSAFTMIELIFVIVILGILASIAIPKLAATRDDAKIVTISHQVQLAIDEISAYAMSQGRVDGLINMSQVLANLNHQGKLSKTSSTVTSVSMNDKDVYLFAYDNDGDLEDCLELKVDSNAKTLQVIHNSLITGKVCQGVLSVVREENITIGGERVVF